MVISEIPQLWRSPCNAGTINRRVKRRIDEAEAPIGMRISATKRSLRSVDANRRRIAAMKSIARIRLHGEGPRSPR